MKNYYLSILLLCSTTILFAQESVEIEAMSPIEIHGDTEEVPTEESINLEQLGFSFQATGDVYFRQDLNNSDPKTAPATAFANLPGFSLGMANLVFKQDGQKAGFAADFVLGPRGEDATFMSPFLRPDGNSSIINQLYAYWNVSDKVSATIGNFNTFLGYEVISPTGNFNYSTSYMFSYGPFSHTGVKVDAQLFESFSVMAGFFNPTDATEYNPSNDYTGGLQLGYSKGNANVYLNTLVGNDFIQEDITAGITLDEDFYVGFNSSIAKDAFLGAATYLQYSLSDNAALGTRFEYFQDRGLDVLGESEHVIDATLSGNVKAGALTIIPEFRVDLYSDDSIADGELQKDRLSSFLIAAVYNFER